MSSLESWEVFDQVGRACQLNVVLNDTGEYANVDSVIPLPKGMPAPKTDTEPICWDMERWDDAVFQALPEWVAGEDKKSTQYQKEHTPTDTVDFPAQAERSGLCKDEGGLIHLKLIPLAQFLTRERLSGRGRNDLPADRVRSELEKAPETDWIRRVRHCRVSDLPRAQGPRWLL